MDVDDVRRLALALPETTEGTHFRLPAFKVRDKGFAGIDRTGTRVTFALDAETAAAAVAEDPSVYELVTRLDKPIGLSADLATIPEDRLAALVEASWRHVAPKRLLRE